MNEFHAMLQRALASLPDDTRHSALIYVGINMVPLIDPKTKEPITLEALIEVCGELNE